MGVYEKNDCKNSEEFEERDTCVGEQEGFVPSVDHRGGGINTA